MRGSPRAASRPGTSEYYVTPGDVVSAVPRVAAVHDQPFGNASAVPTYYCAKLARDDGVDTLLGGDGGDELFGGNARYATQYFYSLYGDLPQPLRQGVLEPAVGLLPGVGIIGKARRYMAHASMPMPARYDHYNLLQRLGPRRSSPANSWAGCAALRLRSRSSEPTGPRTRIR
jgi:asparagine synthase (glutamine-hydrolysing)